MLKRIPEETRKKLSGKGYFAQDGYILQYLPVPPNCLSGPEISDGVNVMSLVSQLRANLKCGPLWFNLCFSFLCLLCFMFYSRILLFQC